MRWKGVIAALLLAVAAVSPAAAQRGGGSEWELLGEQTVSFGRDRDVVEINRSEDYFRDRRYRQLRFVVTGSDVLMRSITLNYLNGYSEQLSVDRLLRVGEQVPIDLRGERSFLRQIVMDYSARPGIDLSRGQFSLRKATVKVFGERVAAVPPPPPPPPRPPETGWDVIDTQRFERTAERVTFYGGQGEGRIGQIRLRAIGESINISRLRVRFRNGETQVIDLDQRLENGEQTRPIDLEGDLRFLESVVVSLRPARRPGRGELQLLGVRRPAAGPAAGYEGRGWVPLSQKTVGFRVARDVIPIGRSDEYYRNRAFRALHLVAERAAIDVIAARVVYLNGYAEDYQINRTIRVGGDLPIELRGERSFLSSIELTYRSRPSFRGQAVIKVFGEPRR
jgi:hypothetical protein